MRVFVDTNVLLDIALGRSGLADGSRNALEKCGTEGHALFLAWHTLSNIFYILQRDQGVEKTTAFLAGLLDVLQVAPVAHADAVRALAHGLSDFEDALQLSAAESCRAEVLLTRNTADFGRPTALRVLTPEEFLTGC